MPASPPALRRRLHRPRLQQAEGTQVATAGRLPAAIAARVKMEERAAGTVERSTWADYPPPSPLCAPLPPPACEPLQSSQPYATSLQSSPRPVPTAHDALPPVSCAKHPPFWHLQTLAVPTRRLPLPSQPDEPECHPRPAGASGLYPDEPSQHLWGFLHAPRFRSLTCSSLPASTTQAA